MIYRLYQWVWAGLDWLYPPHCGGCGKPGARWCKGCQKITHVLSIPVCPVCGQEQGSPEICEACHARPPRFTALRSYAEFKGPLRQALLRLKYAGDVALGEALAMQCIQMVESLKWKIDLVTPVPAGGARWKQRGYNQAALLAAPVAMSQGWNYRPQALKKVRETRSQVGLTATERKENVGGAFRARADLVAGNKVLVVDDITTTGATINACTEALLEAGAAQVYGITLARTSFYKIEEANDGTGS